MSVFVKSVLGVSLVLVFSGLRAQGPRDPTQPPLEAGVGLLATPQASNAPNALNATEPALSMVVRGGVFYVVQGTRLVALGQKLGDARIERISETEVWLRRGGVLTKRALFAGVSLRPIASEDVAPGAQLSRSTP